MGWLDQDDFLWDERSHAVEYFGCDGKVAQLAGVVSLPAVVEALLACYDHGYNSYDDDKINTLLAELAKEVK